MIATLPMGPLGEVQKKPLLWGMIQGRRELRYEWDPLSELLKGLSFKDKIYDAHHRILSWIPLCIELRIMGFIRWTKARYCH